MCTYIYCVCLTLFEVFQGVPIVNDDHNVCHRYVLILCLGCAPGGAIDNKSELDGAMARCQCYSEYNAWTQG